MCGTPNYISPEVATRGAHGLETDVWGLGVMLYTMLVGKPPFDTEDGVRSTLTRVVMSEVKFPPNLSIEARDLITSLLRKNPRERIKLIGLLDHPFMTKNNMIHRSASSISTRTDPSSRWLPNDSGVSSSYQISAVSHSQSQSQSQLSEFPVSARLPVINGALRRQRPDSPPRSNLSQANNNTPCCSKGHVSTNNRREDCSQCFPSNGHDSAANNYHDQLRGKIRDENYGDCGAHRPTSVALYDRPPSSTNRCLPPPPTNEAGSYYAEQPKSYLSGCGGINPGNSNCSHAFKTCSHNQCSHIESCSCLHTKTSTCSVNNGGNVDCGPSLSTHSQGFGSRQKSSHGNYSVGHKETKNGNGSMSGGVSHQYSNENGSSEPRPRLTIQIPSIFSKRLRPVRQKTKHVIFNIMDNSEVCLEFLKTKDGVEKVSEVLRISPDGMRVNRKHIETALSHTYIQN